MARTQAEVDAEILEQRLVLEAAKNKLMELTKEKATIRQPDMPPAGTAMSVSLTFQFEGPTYRYLILHVPGKGYYTTAAVPEHMFFATWAELWKWIDGPDVYDHGPVRRMEDSQILVKAKELK